LKLIFLATKLLINILVDENLYCISLQLQSNQLGFIIEQLEILRSWSINDLKRFITKVGKALKEARSNLIYLDIVRENCKAFLEPNKVHDFLPKIIHIIRYVWNESSYYNVS
jgi:hypothetical protein